VRQGRTEQDLERLEEDWLNLQEALEALVEEQFHESGSSNPTADRQG
jgi:hypothetical protein